MIIVFNPAAGPRRRALLDPVLAALAARGAEVELRATGGPGDATRIAREAALPADRLIVAAGGDGTIAEVAAGLLDNPARMDFRLGVIPLGTANVLAHEIGLARRPEAVVAALLDGRLRPLHVGRIGEGATARAFLMMAGAGFDAAVVAAVGPRLKRLLGKGAYVLHTLRLAATGRFAPLDVIVDGVPMRAKSVVVCNGAHYGGPYRLAPNADLGASGFEVVLLDGAGGAGLVAQGLRLMRGTLHSAPGTRIVTARVIEIIGGGPLQADGDIVAFLPTRIQASCGFLTLTGPLSPTRA
jgi:diacylglycerol kinase (ATP)